METPATNVPLPSASADPPLDGRRRRRGSILFLAVGLVTVLLAVSVLTVDWGVRQVAAGELQDAVDAATLYGVRGLTNNYQTAESRVYAALAETPVRGRPVSKSSVTIEAGLWDPKLRVFEPLSGTARNSATALRVSVRLTGDDGVKTPFAASVGLSKMPVAARATATRGVPYNIDVDAKACPYLAGMPDGSKVKFTSTSKLSYAHDTIAPESTPVGVSFPVVPGQTIYFRDVSGSTGDHASGLTYGLEGNTSRNKIKQAAVNGINSTTAPLNSLMAIFLDDRTPDSWAPEAQLDFSSTASREFDRLTPTNKQVFFIGDGVQNGTQRLQEFVVPPGATRLFLGLNDEVGYWWDNFGAYRTTAFVGTPKLVD